MNGFWDAIGRHYQTDIVDQGKQPQFFLLAAFLITFCLVRFITHSIRHQRFKFLHNVSVGGTHVHHLVPGILLILLTGYIGVALDPQRGRHVLAALFGIGAALTLDEFELWLHLKDVYWTKQGRKSVDAVIITATLAGLVLLGRQFWVDAAREVQRLVS